MICTDLTLIQPNQNTEGNWSVLIIVHDYLEMLNICSITTTALHEAALIYYLQK